MIGAEIEAVARAFYETLEDARGWDREPEVIKEKFRQHALVAIEAIDEHRLMATTNVVDPVVMRGNSKATCDYLIESDAVSVLPISTFRTVLLGPKHVFEVANRDYFKLLHFRDLISIPVREALPELKGQSYYELLDHVYETKRPFVGMMLPLLIQPKPGAPLEEHIIDLVYRPIEDETGQVIGIFAEGHDRTRWARAE